MLGTLIDGCPDLISPIYTAKREQMKQYPCHVNRASEAGHPCERYLVYARARWEDKLLHDVEVEFIFEGGRMIEEMAVNQLKQGGWSLIEQNRSYSWRALQITGHIDVKVLIGNMLGGEKSIAYPVEIKGLNAYDYDSLNCIEDFLKSRKMWIKKYPSQLTLYMLMSNIEHGCFYLVRVPGFRPKQIWVHLDYTYAEDILKKLERVNKHVKEGTLPEGVDDFDICQYCGFSHICLPEIIGKEFEIIDSDELLADIEEWFVLKTQKKKYDKLDEKIKKMLKGKEKGVVGEYIIKGRSIDKKEVIIPASKYWKMDIVQMGKNKKLLGAEE